MSFVGGYEHVDQMPSHLLLDYSEKKNKTAHSATATNRREKIPRSGLVELSSTKGSNRFIKDQTLFGNLFFFFFCFLTNLHFISGADALHLLIKPSSICLR